MSAEETKQRILNAATTVFSHNGFAAANVADISAEADVNVALIYRYFMNKEHLLHAVLDQFVTDAALVRKLFIKGRDFSTTDAELSVIADWAWDFFQQRHDLVRVILFELLNDEDQLDMIYNFFDSILAEHLPPELTDRKTDQSIIMGLASFFYGLVPFLMIIAIGDQWADHYQISGKDLKHHFVAAFNRLFIRHIMDVLNADSHSFNER